MKKIKKILIMGLPGSGKSFLSKSLAKDIKGIWLNADSVRKKFADWDFSLEGRKRQALRMSKLASFYIKKKKIVVADFICPLNITRKIFKPDLLVWMDTIKKGRFNNTNKIFFPPKKYDLRIKEKNLELNKLKIKDKLKKYKWNNRLPTAQMLGRYQPWHKGHKKLFEEIIKRVNQVNIQIKDVHQIGDNPFGYKRIKKMINLDLKEYKNRYKISLAPNITNIFYGRTVGYKINKINLDKKIQKISATKIRSELRKKGKLKSI